MSDASHTETPTHVGTYSIVRVLGEGGMGRVLLGRDEGLSREVAIKVMLPDLARDQEMSARFLREARAMARISSPHVVTVFQVGEHDGAPFLVMELLVGEDLGARLKREGRVSLDDAVRFVRDTMHGLDAAARAGLIHRDVKPANLFVADGRVKLTDFGLARPLDGSADLTQAGLVVGTPHYLAPEIAKGAPPSVQSDLYALGATFFELLAGRPPYPGKSAMEVLSAHITSSVPDVGAVVSVPPPIAALVTRLLAKDPRDRFATYADLERALDEAVVAKTSGSTQIFGAVASSDAKAAEPPVDVTAQTMLAHKTAVLGSSTAVTGGSSPLPDERVDPASQSGVLAKHSGTTPTVKTAPLTVMFTDIAGYTERTGQQSREEAARWLAIHDALLQPVIKAFGGKLVKTIGDAFLATFTSPTDAVLCGMTIQDRLYLHNQSASSSEQIHVRVALSAGEVRLHRGDIFGEAVNLAARLEGLGTPGEVLLSDAVYATMNAAEATLEHRGEHRFKGIARAVQVYACRPTSEPGSPPFGGAHLSRVNDQNAMARVVDVAGKAALAADVARVKVGTGLRAALHKLSSIDRGNLDVAALARQLAPVAIAVVVAALFVAVWTLVSDRRLSRIDDGHAEAVIEEIEAVPQSERTPDDELMRGHAYFALDKTKTALKGYARAIEQGVVDDRALENTLSLLENKDASQARELLVTWPDKSVEGELEDLLDGGWFERNHALYVLEQRDAVDDDTVTKVGIADLETSVCEERKYGVALLKRRGRGKAAIAALESARDRPLSSPALLCFGLDYAGAIEAIEKRGK